MAATQNYIDESERKFLQSAYFAALGDLWTSDATLVVDPVTYHDAEFGSLHLSGAASCYLKYNIWSTPATDVPSQYALTLDYQTGGFVETFCWVRPTKNCTIRLTTTLHQVYLSGSTFMLSTDSGDIHVGEAGEHVVKYGSIDEPIWHLIRAVPIAIPDDGEKYSVGFTLEVEYDDTVSPGELNMSRPTSFLTHALWDNAYLTEMVARIPNVFLEKDFAYYTKNEVTFPLLRLIDVCTNYADSVYTKYQEIRYADAEEYFDPADQGTYSTLVDQLLADSETLAWLSQFRGNQLIVTYEPSTDGTPWTVFRLDESVLDGTDVLASSTTPTTGFAGGLEEYFKWQVENGFYGHNAGKIDGMISAIQLLLTGTKYIDYTMTANTLHFETKIGETFGGDDLSVGDESPYIVQILEPMRPLGMIITHELVS
jgi:hypothetical protein